MEAQPVPEEDPSEAATVSPPPPGEAWTVMHMVRWSSAYLEQRGVDEARLNAELLLAHVLGVKRLQLYLEFDRPLERSELDLYKPLLKRRAEREPLQYVLGTTPFRTLELAVDPRVLIPRPETEYLLDVVRRLAGEDHQFARALDIGTGSGAIALSLAAEGIADSVVATDLSPDALKIASENAERCELAGVVDFRLGSCTGPVAGESFDLVISNPPYLSESEWAETLPEMKDWEPAMALKSGSDGLDVVRTLIQEVPTVLSAGGWMAMELATRQTDVVAAQLEAQGHYTQVTVEQDLTERSRYVVARKH